MSDFKCPGPQVKEQLLHCVHSLTSRGWTVGRNPANHLRCMKPSKEMGKTIYQYQLVQDFFLSTVSESKQLDPLNFQKRTHYPRNQNVPKKTSLLGHFFQSRNPLNPSASTSASQVGHSFSMQPRVSINSGWHSWGFHSTTFVREKEWEEVVIDRLVACIHHTSMKSKTN